jgi:DNA-binding MarR family transcriptional regulator
MYLHLIRRIIFISLRCLAIELYIHVLVRTPRSTRASRTPAVRLPCACANLRRAARVVTQFYDEALRPGGLRATQFTLLQALKLAPGISQKGLARLLGMDSTTLTRTLSLLRRRGWLRAEAGNDRRELHLALTPSGQREYNRVLPYWRSAQKRLRQAFGEANWNQVVDAAVRAAEATPESR